MKPVKLFEAFINEDIIVDSKTQAVLFDSNDSYNLSQFLKICKTSTEAKEALGYSSNFGKGQKMAEFLKKNLSQHKFQCRVNRSEWNYGGNLMVTIELKGNDYKSVVFRFSSNDSTRQPQYSFSELFDGTIKPSSGRVENEWGTGIVHGSYQSISKFDEFMSDIVGVFNDYQRVNGQAFDMKTALAQFKVNDKILSEWNALKDKKILKQYEIAKENARKAHRDISLREPYIETSTKTVYYKTDEPRELRHPDEYGERADKIMSSKEYGNYEKAQTNISDLIYAFCKKHGFEFVWAASW